MSSYLIFGFGVLAGFCLGLCVFALLDMVARSERDMEGFESAIGLSPEAPLTMGKDYTWCPNCHASFKGAVCPGCSEDEAN